MHVDQLSGQPIGRGDGTLMIGEWTVPAPPEGEEPVAMTPVHLHPHDNEACYVVEGRLRVQLGDKTVTVGAGGAIVAIAGTLHTHRADT